MRQDIDSLIHLTRVFSSDIDITFGLAKCGRLIVNRGKVIAPMKSAYQRVK